MEMSKGWKSYSEEEFGMSIVKLNRLGAGTSLNILIRVIAIMTQDIPGSYSVMIHL
jgi:hypothetical protein